MDKGQYELIKTSVKAFNDWRAKNPRERVDLRGAELKGMNLQGVDLSEAWLQNAGLGKANLNNADFTGANISHAIFTESQCKGADFDGVIADGTIFFRANLSGASMRFGYWDNSCFTKANLIKANLLQSEFNGADFRGAWLFFAKLPFSISNGQKRKMISRRCRDESIDYSAGQNVKLVQRAIIFVLIVLVMFGSFIFYGVHSKKLGGVGNAIIAFMSYSFGNAHTLSENYPKAIECYKKSLKAKPDMAINYYRLAFVYDAQGKYKEADRCFKKFIELRPKDDERIKTLKALMEK